MWCRKQLGKLQKNADAFAAKNATILAISVDSRETGAALAGRLGVEFPLLSDTDLATIRAYGVEHVGTDISLPATFVIDESGTVKMAYVGERPRDRPDLDQILAAL